MQYMGKWEMVRLGDVCSGTVTNIAQKDLGDNNGDFPIYGASGFIKNVDFYKQENPYIAVVKDGSGIGRVSRMPAQSSVIGTMQYVLPGKSIDADFLYYVMIQMRLARFYTGATIPHIYFKDYKKEFIPLPPLPVQRKIADTLDQVNSLIETRKKQIEKLDLLVKSQFIEIFGDPVTNPKGWEVSCIEDTVADGKNALKAGPFGSSLKKEYYVKSGYKIYGQEQVIRGDATYGDYYIDEEKYRSLQSCAVQANDVLISLVGTYGKLLIIPEDYEPGIINPRLMKITFNPLKINTTYFSSFFGSDSMIQRLSENSHGGTMDILNLRMVKKIIIPLPPLDLQNQFAAFVERVEVQKARMKQGLDKLEVMYKALMQEYFG